MGENNNLIGRLVHSIQGRDNGKSYLVWRELENGFVLLVDGDNRKILNPKKKSVKHLEITDVVLDNIRTKILEDKKIFDAEIYSNIRKAQISNSENEED